ncbi:SdpI family protein [Thermococcus pacificus]|uniref:SdpI family protein n=1 Tax=Thermococcus pacificus TaxID=71998 RepID=UPI001E47C7EA|nr:SdpI family protein [Thermococcus pacificus]
MEFQTAFEVFIGLTLLAAGLLTLAFRNRQNPFIGVRIGYTYMSKEAWRKANTAGGLFFVGFSLFLVIMAIAGASIGAFLIVLIVGVLAGVGVSVAVAKRTYELEELSEEAPEKPTGERIEANIKPYLLV